MKVIVYVEGPSDQKALQALLKPILQTSRARGVGISFSPQGGKAAILSDVPRRAANILQQEPHDWVFALPDLYPILERAPLATVESGCSQCFGPFVRELRALAEGRDPDAPPAPAT